MKKEQIDMGWQIVVVDQGFVYVGKVRYTGTGFVEITNADNLRQWGTTRGLGELAHGPTAKTVRDPVGIVMVPVGRVVLYIATTGWE